MLRSENFYRKSFLHQNRCIKRCVKSLFKCYLILLEKIYGFKTLHTDSLAMCYEFLTFQNEEETLKIFKKILRHYEKPFTFLDVGANIGYYSVAAYKWASTHASVYAFEPNPTVFEVLKYNASKRPNINPIQLAFFNKEGSLDFHVNEGSSQAGSLHKDYQAEKKKNLKNVDENIEETHFKVPTLPGDTFIEKEKITSVDLIKVDTEGSDIEVLEGLTKTFERADKIALLCEFSTQSLLSSGHTPRALYETLVGLGLEIHDVGKYALPTQILELKDIETISARQGTDFTNLICFKGYDKKEIHTILSDEA